MKTITTYQLKMANKVVVVSMAITMSANAKAQTSTKQKNKINVFSTKVMCITKSGFSALPKFSVLKNRMTENKKVNQVRLEREQKRTNENPELVQKFKITSIIGLGYPQPHTKGDDFPMSMMVEHHAAENLFCEAGMSMDSFGKEVMCSTISAKNKIGMYNFELRAAEAIPVNSSCGMYVGGRLGMSYYSNVNKDFVPYGNYIDGDGSKLWPSAQLLVGTEIYSSDKRNASIELSTWSPKVLALGVKYSL